MKSIKYIITIISAALAIASCDINKAEVFDDKDAFVGFDVSSVSFAENAKDVVRIPVTLASVKGLEENIRFEIVSPEVKGAKEGVNFELVTKSGVLSFDSENRTQYIELKGIYDGVYTGDLSFSIVLKDGESVPAGSDNTCNVKISDVDHPLAAILGEYTMNGTQYPNSPVSGIMEIRKDAEDPTVVWFYNLMLNSGWAADDTMYYGIVNADKTEISIPLGQESEYKYSNGNAVSLWGLSTDLESVESGNYIIKINTNANGGIELEFEKELGLWFYIIDAGSLRTMMPGSISAVKN